MTKMRRSKTRKKVTRIKTKSSMNSSRRLPAADSSDSMRNWDEEPTRQFIEGSITIQEERLLGASSAWPDFPKRNALE